MMELVTWPRNPWSIFDELESLHDDATRAAHERRSEAWRSNRRSYPLMNVWTSEDGVVIDCELPGANPEDLEISVQGDELTLKGKVNAVEPAEGDTFHRRERPRGEFTRTLELPFRANTDAVKANYKNGILRLAVPRSEEEKPRKIAIEA
jgi:HSP20 family protein